MKPVICVVAAIMVSIALGCDGGSDSKKVRPPSPPAIVIAVPISTDRIDVHWSMVSGADSYNLYWSTSPGVSKSTGTKISGVQSPFGHTGLSQGTTYYYVVTTVKGLGESEESLETNAIPFAGSPGGGGAVGILDPSFGGLGWVVPGPGYGFSVALDASRRILVVGQGSPGIMTLWRLEESGALDQTFGQQGVVEDASPLGGSPGSTFGYDLVLDSAGRILVAGGAWSAAPREMVLWRLMPDGQLDTSFGGQGWVAHAGEGEANGRAITLDGLGRILVSGSTSGTSERMALWRFDGTGSLDPSLAGQGWLVHDGGLAGIPPVQGDLLTDGQDRIVVTAGHRDFPDYYMVTWRFLSDGSLDPAWAGTGWIVVPDAYGASVDLDGQGRVIVTGTVGERVTPQSWMSLWRLQPDGTPDVTFGWDRTGEVRFPGSGGGEDVTIDRQGNIVVAGWGRGWGACGQTDGLVIWRFDSTGLLDVDFDGRGWVSFADDYPGICYSLGTALTIDDRDRIVVAGEAGVGSPWDMAVWRYR